ncbi:MAG: hypothetical protein DLM53_00140 [Candidatus Eremiobacter antarcticus]|nr:MAG: hypothetical protein DLM53_00140 [Candidatus Eremiobacter sp. RRmetagenome_bin22]
MGRRLSFSHSGRRFSYSNLGFDLAGYVLERVTGMPYPDALNTLIFKPAGMLQTHCQARRRYHVSVC